MYGWILYTFYGFAALTSPHSLIKSASTQFIGAIERGELMCVNYKIAHTISRVIAHFILRTREKKLFMQINTNYYNRARKCMPKIFNLRS